MGVEFRAQVMNHAMSGSASVRSVHNFKVHPDQIKQMGVGEAPVFNKDNPNRVGGADEELCRQTLIFRD
jgi:hypothetical protein